MNTLQQTGTYPMISRGTPYFSIPRETTRGVLPPHKTEVRSLGALDTALKRA
jgi:hypothetical protein